MRSRDPDFEEFHDDASDSDEEPRQKPSRARKQAATKPRRAPKRPAGLVNIKTLIDESLLNPGEDVLTVEYKGQTTLASLTADGHIRWKDMFFESPSAFSIYLKRLINPTRKADDGWKTVKYAGKYLEQYKLELLARRYNAENGTGSAADTASASSSQPPSKRARTPAPAPARPTAQQLSKPPAAPSSARQLAVRLKGASAGAATAAAAAGKNNSSSTGGQGSVWLQDAGGTGDAAAAAAAGSTAEATRQRSSSSGPSYSGVKTEHTPRPPDLGSMAPADHDFAPKEGELAGLSEELLLEVPSGPKHFLSGMQLEGLSSNYSSNTAAAEADNNHSPPLGSNKGLPAAAAAASGSCEQDPAPSAAAGRPRRKVRAPDRLINSALDSSERDGHSMVPCQQYAEGCQPFKVQVSPLVEVMMDFHAHLDRHEVIGLLAGTWDSASKLLRIERAFPVREAIASGAANDGINVEMDPEDQFKVTEVISELYHLSVVGWYHSHPSFPALPSVIDIANQLQMQEQARCPVTGAEPYVAAIMSPYDQRLPGVQSSVTWFTVKGPASSSNKLNGAATNVLEQGYAPMELCIERLLRHSTADSLAKLIPVLKTTLLRYIDKRSAANLAAVWKPPLQAAAAVTVAAAAHDNTRLGKLLGSVQAWWPCCCSQQQAMQFLELLQQVFLDVGLTAALPAAPKQQQQHPSKHRDGSSSSALDQQHQAAAQQLASSPAAAAIADAFPLPARAAEGSMLACPQSAGLSPATAAAVGITDAAPAAAGGGDSTAAHACDANDATEAGAGAIIGQPLQQVAQPVYAANVSQMKQFGIWQQQQQLTGQAATAATPAGLAEEEEAVTETKHHDKQLLKADGKQTMHSA